MIEGTTQLLLKSIVDEMQERSGIAAEKSLKIQMEHYQENVTKEEIIEYRHSGGLASSPGTSTKGNLKVLPPKKISRKMQNGKPYKLNPRKKKNQRNIRYSFVSPKSRN